MTSVTDLKDPKWADVAGYDPSLERHGYATIEMWVGQTPVNVGNVYGPELYRVASRIMEQECAPQGSNCWQWDWKKVTFNTRYVMPGDDNFYEGM